MWCSDIIRFIKHNWRWLRTRMIWFYWCISFTCDRYCTQCGWIGTLWSSFLCTIIFFARIVIPTTEFGTSHMFRYNLCHYRRYIRGISRCYFKRFRLPMIWPRDQTWKVMLMRQQRWWWQRMLLGFHGPSLSSARKSYY